MISIARPLFLLMIFAIVAATARADVNADLDVRVDGLQHLEGFVDLYWDADSGQLLLRVDDPGETFIYQSSLARGVGSNDLGLDRGQLGSTALVSFERIGPRLLLIEHNTDYRARSDNSAEQAAVEASFARSVLWGFDIIASDNDAVLVDATPFFLRDAHGMATRLSRAQQGRYSANEGRSAIFLPRTRAFPDNTEVEAVVTYTGDRQYNPDGSAASDILPTVVPDPTAITVHLHHSFVRLPPPGYEPLPYDPRDGLVPARPFFDYASAIGDPLRVTHARRHRLHRVDPSATSGPAVEPIVYYVDPGAPEPIRSALMEGAAWWNEAFEAAGYEDAFQVRLLPEDADPMDVRFNVIQWVHRSTRGWSYGSSVVDPRTGEIIKGHVTLGSLRVRQDYLIAEGLLAPYDSDERDDRMLDLSLARIRQLSAHEVGHTIGLLHNFAASVFDRASVMDYPFPKVQFDDEGGFDLSEAYGIGVGEWDRRTINYAYRDFPDGTDEAAARRAILEQTIADGYLFVSDSDSRSPGSAHPLGNLWDNGADALTEWAHLLAVRAHALDRFGEATIRQGRPLATIEEALVPLYLFHRFQIQAVGKLIGGQWFRYNLRGDGQELPRPVAAERQRAAMEALLNGLDPDVLQLPDSLLSVIPPRPPGHPRDRESFARQTGVTFDPLAPANAAVSLTLDVLLHPERAARMNAQHARDGGLPGFHAVLDALVALGWDSPRRNGMAGAIQRDAHLQVLQGIMALASDRSAAPQVRAQALAAVADIGARIGAQAAGKLLGGRRGQDRQRDWADHDRLASQWIAAFLDNPDATPIAVPRGAPPGSPIGSGDGY